MRPVIPIAPFERYPKVLGTQYSIPSILASWLQAEWHLSGASKVFAANFGLHLHLLEFFSAYLVKASGTYDLCFVLPNHRL